MERANPVPERLKKLSSLTLHKGIHRNFDEGHCANEVIAWLAGEPHSHAPDCVSPTIIQFLGCWNDSLPDDEARTRLLRPLLQFLVGTNDGLDPSRRDAIADWVVTQCAPTFLGEVPELEKHAETLRSTSGWKGARNAANEAMDAAAVLVSETSKGLRRANSGETGGWETVYAARRFTALQAGISTTASFGGCMRVTIPARDAVIYAVIALERQGRVDRLKTAIEIAQRGAQGLLRYLGRP